MQVTTLHVQVQGIWADRRWCFSVGLDQRLRSWRIAPPHDMLEHAAAQAGGEGVCNLRSAEPERVGAPLLEEGLSTAVMVLEPGALAVTTLDPSQGSYHAAVAGRGTQVLHVRTGK